jgi:hypothetical protein
MGVLDIDCGRGVSGIGSACIRAILICPVYDVLVKSSLHTGENLVTVMDSYDS